MPYWYNDILMVTSGRNLPPSYTQQCDSYEPNQQENYRIKLLGYKLLKDVMFSVVQTDVVRHGVLIGVIEVDTDPVVVAGVVHHGVDI